MHFSTLEAMKSKVKVLDGSDSGEDSFFMPIVFYPLLTWCLGLVSSLGWLLQVVNLNHEGKASQTPISHILTLSLWKHHKHCYGDITHSNNRNEPPKWKHPQVTSLATRRVTSRLQIFPTEVPDIKHHISSTFVLNPFYKSQSINFEEQNQMVIFPARLWDSLLLRHSS